jgi:hypothetical protein
MRGSMHLRRGFPRLANDRLHNFGIIPTAFSVASSAKVRIDTHHGPQTYALETKMNKIADLAKEMGVTEADVVGFVECLRHWISKGYSFEAAIAKHMEVMAGMVNRAVPFAGGEAGRLFAADIFYGAR